MCDNKGLGGRWGVHIRRFEALHLWVGARFRT